MEGPLAAQVLFFLPLNPSKLISPQPMTKLHAGNTPHFNASSRICTKLIQTIRGSLHIIAVSWCRLLLNSVSGVEIDRAL
jgi:hypothetical protein